MDNKSKEHHQKYVELQDKHAQEIKRRIDEMKETEAKLNRDLEDLRKQKDKKIVELSDTIESNRKKYE